MHLACHAMPCMCPWTMLPSYPCSNSMFQEDYYCIPLCFHTPCMPCHASAHEPCHASYPCSKKTTTTYIYAPSNCMPCHACAMDHHAPILPLSLPCVSMVSCLLCYVYDVPSDTNIPTMCRQKKLQNLIRLSVSHPREQTP